MAQLLVSRNSSSPGQAVNSDKTSNEPLLPKMGWRNSENTASAADRPEIVPENSPPSRPDNSLPLLKLANPFFAPSFNF